MPVTLYVRPVLVRRSRTSERSWHKRRRNGRGKYPRPAFSATWKKAGTELTEEDTKWLKKIEQNPGMVQGYGEGNTPAFRNWMLLRGSDLLSGTPLYRPAFEVE